MIAPFFQREREKERENDFLLFNLGKKYDRHKCRKLVQFSTILYLVVKKSGIFQFKDFHIPQAIVHFFFVYHKRKHQVMLTCSGIYSQRPTSYQARFLLNSEEIKYVDQTKKKKFEKKTKKKSNMHHGDIKVQFRTIVHMCNPHWLVCPLNIRYNYIII